MLLCPAALLLHRLVSFVFFLFLISAKKTCNKHEILFRNSCHSVANDDGGRRWDDVGICRVFYLHTHPQLVAVAVAVSCLQLGSRLGGSRKGGQQKPQAKHLSHRMRRVGNARGRRKSDNVNHSGHAMAMAMAMTMKYEICNPRRRQQQQQQQVEEEA